MLNYIATLQFKKNMTEKTKSKRNEKTDTIGIFNAISKEKASFFEKKDNSWWWTFALFIFLLCLIGIWSYTTFFQTYFEQTFIEQKP